MMLTYEHNETLFSLMKMHIWFPPTWLWPILWSIKLGNDSGCDVLCQQVWAGLLPVVCTLWVHIHVLILRISPRLNCRESLEQRLVMLSTGTAEVKMMGCWTLTISANLCLLRWTTGSDLRVRKKLQHSWSS